MAAKTALMMMALLIGPIACVDPAPEDVARTEQEMRNETIEVHGCSPGFSEVTYGDGFTCVDPWPGIGGAGGFGGFDWGPGWGDDPTKWPGGPRRGPGGGDGGERAEECLSGGGGCTPAARQWKCDVSCNVVEDKPGARCPDRVTGRGTGPSSDEACKAAKDDANSKVPRDCHKRHCNCRCRK